MEAASKEVALQVMKQQVRQSEMLLELLARPKYDSFAARVAAPIWWLVWVLSLGKMGKGSRKVKTPRSHKWTPPFVEPAPNQIPHVVNGSTYIRDGNHVLVGQRRPLADDADLRPDSMFRSKKCTYGFTQCSGRECHGRCES